MKKDNDKVGKATGQQEAQGDQEAQGASTITGMNIDLAGDGGIRARQSRCYHKGNINDLRSIRRSSTSFMRVGQKWAETLRVSSKELYGWCGLGARLFNNKTVDAFPPLAKRGSVR